MFNTDTTVPDWEKSPENHAENQENTEISQRAKAWAEAFPNDEAENPWLNANMEEQAAQPSPNPSQEEDAPNQLNSTDNIVANQMQEVWNNGNGGQALGAAYDDLRGSFSPESIKIAADTIEPEVANTIRENKSKSVNSETELALDNNLNEELPPVTNQQQVQADLYNLTASAGATALGAQASAEAATNALQQTNDTLEAQAAMRDLEEAQRTLQDIQSEIPMVTNQLEGDPLAEQTAESTVRDAQKMVDLAQESLQTAQDAAVERQEFIEDSQETIENLQEQGIQMEEINQSIDETGGVEELQEKVAPAETNETNEEDEYAEPRVSIFG